MSKSVLPCWGHCKAQLEGGLGPFEVQEGWPLARWRSQPKTTGILSPAGLRQGHWSSRGPRPAYLLHRGMSRHHLCPHGQPQRPMYYPIYRQTDYKAGVFPPPQTPPGRLWRRLELWPRQEEVVVTNHVAIWMQTRGP